MRYFTNVRVGSTLTLDSSMNSVSKLYLSEKSAFRVTLGPIK